MKRLVQEAFVIPSGSSARAECHGCAALVASLRPGQCRACVVCGAVLEREAGAPPEPLVPVVRAVPRSVSFGARTSSARDPLARLLSDCELIALWETRASVRAVDLDPESRLRRDPRAGDEDRERRRELALRAGMELASRLVRVESVSAREGAVIRWLVERAGPARVTAVSTSRGASLGTGLYELCGRAFVRRETAAVWRATGDARMQLTRYGRELLEAAAAAWATWAVPVP